MAEAATGGRAKRNMIANFVGSGWGAILGFLLVPVYIRLLGIEAYGLVGIYLSLTALLMVLDLGLTPTITRELALLSACPDKKQEARDLVRTLEIVYWIIGLVLAGCGLLSANWVAHSWVHAQNLSPAAVAQSVRIMAFIIAVQWPISFYTGGLMGLQRQVAMNGINILCGTLKSAGTVLVLWLVMPTIQAYFVCQGVVLGLQTLLLLLLLWKSLPPAPLPARFQWTLVKQNGRFAASLSLVMIISTLFNQLDKVVLSKFLSLTLFGYYALATQVAVSLNYLVTPVLQAVFPRMAQLTAQEDEPRQARLYHQSCQGLAAVLFPVAVMAMLFARPLLLAYVHNVQTVDNTATLAAVLIAATALNSFLLMPHQLQVAYGWTRLPIIKSAVSLLALLPLLLWLAPRYGSVGVAWGLLCIHAAWLCVEPAWTHSRLLRHELAAWYVYDFGLPLLISLIIGLTARLLYPVGLPPLLTLLWVGAATVGAMLAIAGALPLLRVQMQRVLARLPLHRYVPEKV